VKLTYCIHTGGSVEEAVVAVAFVGNGIGGAFTELQVGVETD